MMKTSYLQSTLKQFKYYELLGKSTIDQLSDNELFAEPAIESNSIAIIVKHLHGNMLSRWTDFLNSDGEKPWRNRDDEFENHAKTRDELLAQWKEGWSCLLKTIETLSDSDLDKTVYIRNDGHTVVDAINRQLCHYSYHVGQIVYIGKYYRKGEWKSLSIPKGNSEAYNKNKFNNEKQGRHFTDEFLKG